MARRRPDLAETWLNRLIEDINSRLNAKGLEPFVFGPDKALSDILMAIASSLEFLDMQATTANTFRIENMVGIELFDNAPLAGVVPSPGTQSTLQVELENTRNYVLDVKEGTRFKTREGLEAAYWRLTERVFIPADSTVEVYLRAEKVGPVSVDTDDSIEVVTSGTGIDSVTILAASVPGSPEDTEDSIRLKMSNRNAVLSFGSNAYIELVLERIASLRKVRVIDNKHSADRVVGGHSLPRGHIMVVVFEPVLTANQNSLLGSALIDLLPPAVPVLLPEYEEEGVVLTIPDNYNTNIQVGYFYATAVTLNIAVEVTKYARKTDGTYYDRRAVRDAIKTRLTAFINNLNYDQVLGGEIIIQQLEGVCTSTAGCQKATVTASFGDDALDSEDLEVDEMSYISVMNIDVT